MIEEDFKPLSLEEATVWDAAHPQPPSGEDYERLLLRWITEDSNEQIAALVPADQAALPRYREVVGGAFDVIVGRGLPAAGDIEPQIIREEQRGDYREVAALAAQAGAEELSVVVLDPKTYNGRVVIWLHGDGKNGLFAAEASLRAEIVKLLAAGIRVIAPTWCIRESFWPTASR